ncbi:MAG: desulfoferrodoxin FeS4 iron-binding domain-containing protein [bacterium]|nr:desulfoferrodoxin FeS4 iron-binding domain-containing protein [bacterium]
MNVENVGESYRCDICGNEIEVTVAGGGELVCCGEPMGRI